MKIGLLTTSFPREEGDSAGAFVLGFARALAGRGHHLEVLAPEPERGAPPHFDGLDLRWIPYLRPRALERTFYGAGVPDNLRHDPLAWLGLGPFSVSALIAAQRAASRWDALVSHWALPSALIAGLIAKGRPHLCVMHSADLHLLSRLPARTKLAQRIASTSSSLLFVSPDHRERFLSMLPPLRRAEVASRAHVCAMGIEPPGAPSGPRRALRQRWGFERFTLLSLGRLVTIKGVDDAIRAVAGSEGIELIIAGDGPERARLEALARGAPVRFTGHVSGQRKRDLMAASDAFVLSSRPMRSGREEGVPTALLEAMGAGLPCVATDTGGIRSIAEQGEPLRLVPPGSPDALRAAIHTLRDDRNLRRRLSRRGERVAQSYHWPALAPELEALLG